jgi:hypothetical protein
MVNTTMVISGPAIKNNSKVRLIALSQALVCGFIIFSLLEVYLHPCPARKREAGLGLLFQRQLLLGCPNTTGNFLLPGHRVYELASRGQQASCDGEGKNRILFGLLLQVVDKFVHGSPYE